MYTCKLQVILPVQAPPTVATQQTTMPGNAGRDVPDPCKVCRRSLREAGRLLAVDAGRLLAVDVGRALEALGSVVSNDHRSDTHDRLADECMATIHRALKTSPALCKYHKQICICPEVQIGCSDHYYSHTNLHLHTACC